MVDVEESQYKMYGGVPSLLTGFFDTNVAVRVTLEAGGAERHPVGDASIVRDASRPNPRIPSGCDRLTGRIPTACG
ncbi:MAG: hypothetical protein LBR57_02045, partial [Alistipes sp.]|nr:hypothetical protein [Alistipes sp.]